MSNRIHLERPDPVTVEIPAEMRAALDALPESRTGNRRRPWTKEEDAAVLEFYLATNKAALGRFFRCCPETVRKRYNELTEDN